MSVGKNSVLAFGPFRLFPTERRLEKDEKRIPASGPAFDLLVVLVERAGEVVSSRTLMERVWRDINVEETSLRFHIKNLRKILGDSGPDNRYIKNVRGRGYCFAAPVERLTVADWRESNNEPLTARSNLPARASGIVGRSDSIETLTRELSKERLVTISGPGGIGKTTLAIVIAETARAGFHGGVFFVDLAPIEDPCLVVSTVATALGAVLSRDDPVSGVIDFLRNKRVLVVLDNCEQVIEAVVQLTDRILRDTHDAHFLATSRETLRSAGEIVHRLKPLEYPPFKADITAKEAMSYPAVQLFVERATASVDDFSLDDELAPAAAEICERLDGIPLAIELAAARVEFFGVGALAKALNDMLSVLTEGRRLGLPRQQTMRATLDWGHDLASPMERTVLRRIAIFRGSFALESAVEVVAGPEASTEGVVEAMAGLVAKSLLTVQSPGGIASYRLLEPTRRYASEKLIESGEAPQIARRHAEHFLRLFTNEQSDRDSHLEMAYTKRIDDVRAALDWSFSQGGHLPVGLNLVAASSQLWFQLCLNLEYRERIERALQMLSETPVPDPTLEMRLRIALGHTFWYMQGDLELMERSFERALQLADQIDGPADWLRLQALWGLWAVQRGRGRYREALAAAERYEIMARLVGDPSFILLGDRILALSHHLLGNQGLARRHTEQVRITASSSGSPRNAPFQLSPQVATAPLLARILWLQGFPDQAMAMLREAIDAAQRSNHQLSIPYVLTFAGCPLSMWTGELIETQKFLKILTDIGARTRNNLRAEAMMRCWSKILCLRKGGPGDNLIASYIESRLDLSTLKDILDFVSTSTVPVPSPDDEVGNALWSLPEVMRVNAELQLWHGGDGATEIAESKLLRSIDLARQQSAVSWELRSATSLAGLWRRTDRVVQARELLISTYDRFTEGFQTHDLQTARRLIVELS